VTVEALEFLRYRQRPLVQTPWSSAAQQASRIACTKPQAASSRSSILIASSPNNALRVDGAVGLVRCCEDVAVVQVGMKENWGHVRTEIYRTEI
jgi:hypothetical protein